MEGYFCIGLIGLAALILVVKPMAEGWQERGDETEAAREAKRQAARSRKELARRQRETSINRAVQLICSARDALGSLPALVSQAAAHLRQAGVEFDERAYGPFWSEIEAAAVCLARYDEALRTVAATSEDYVVLAKTESIELPPLELPRLAVPSTTDLVTDFAALARAAQRDFEFATIYEQRKTNQLLVAGFSSLDASVRSMGHQIEASLDRLSCSLSDAIEVQTDTLQRAQAESASRLSESIDAQTAASTAAMATQTRGLVEEMKRARSIAERESTARVRKDVDGGDWFAH